MKDDSRAMDKKELIHAIDQNAAALHRIIDRHRYMVAAIVEKEAGEKNLQDLSGCGGFRTREIDLKRAIGDAIAVLEESRRSFKSKKLEELRKKLTRVLIEAE